MRKPSRNFQRVPVKRRPESVYPTDINDPGLMITTAHQVMADKAVWSPFFGEGSVRHMMSQLASGTFAEKSAMIRRINERYNQLSIYVKAVNTQAQQLLASRQDWESQVEYPERVAQLLETDGLVAKEAAIGFILLATGAIDDDPESTDSSDTDDTFGAWIREGVDGGTLQTKAKPETRNQRNRRLAAERRKQGPKPTGDTRKGGNRRKGGKRQAA